MSGAGSKQSTPAIPLFGDAYLADTRHLSLEEHGAYLQLLMIAWRTEDCALPDDDGRLARMLAITPGKWRKLKPSVMAFWECADGAWRQRRLTKERAFVEEKRAKNRASAEARWSGQPTENKQPAPCERISERNTPPPPPPKVEKPEANASGKKTTAHGTRLPEDWQPKPFGPETASMVAVWPAGMLERQLAQFRDHYLKTPGAKGRSLDWDASLRTWLRNADEWSFNRGNRQSPAHQGNGLRGSRPDPSLDLLRAAEAEERAASHQAADRPAWPSLSSFGPS